MRFFSPTVLFVCFATLGVQLACAPVATELGDDCSEGTCLPANDEIPENQAHDKNPPRKSPEKIYPNPTESEVWGEDLKNLDPSRLVPQRRLREAMAFLRKNPSLFSNRRQIVLIDYGQPSTTKRFYIINLSTGSVQRHLVAHGRGSDPDFDGYANYFSNKSGSKMTSLGYFVTAETYEGGHGVSLRLNGLSATNSASRERAIVIHGASYVRGDLNPIGRSWGCPALDTSVVQSVISQIKGGSLIYAFAADLP